MKTIQKVTLTTVLLMEAETPEAARAEINAMEPADIVAEMDGGSYVGLQTIEKVETVAPDEVEAECEALNSDAGFFGDLEDEEDDDPDHEER